MNVETVREYMEQITLDDYGLGGVEITEDDFETVSERIKSSNRSLENVVHEYLLEIREVLDAGLDDELEELDDELDDYDFCTDETKITSDTDITNRKRCLDDIISAAASHSKATDTGRSTPHKDEILK